MIDCIIDDRDMIVQAVLDGVLGVEHITDDELFDLEDAVFEAVCDQVSPFQIWDTLQ
jgi:hypothetical protein